MLRCATLNNDEVIAFVDRFVDLHGHLNASGAEGRPSMARPSDILPSATTRAS